METKIRLNGRASTDTNLPLENISSLAFRLLKSGRTLKYLSVLALGIVHFSLKFKERIILRKRFRLISYDIRSQIPSTRGKRKFYFYTIQHKAKILQDDSIALAFQRNR